jgi:hypothetical protein
LTCFRLSGGDFQLTNFCQTGFCSKLEEAYVVPKNPTLVVRWGKGRETLREYMVLRATLHTGEQFVVDPAHLQWGWDECVYDWATFVDLRASSVIDIAPFGQWCSVTCPARNIRLEGGSYEFNIMLLRKEVMKAIVEELREILAPYKEWANFVDLPPSTWLNDTENTYRKLERAMEITEERHTAAGLGRIYFEERENFWKQEPGHDLWQRASWKHNVVATNHTFCRYANVWLSGTEVLGLQSEPNTLKRLWAERMRDVGSMIKVDFKTSLVHSGPSRLLR